MPYVEVNLHFFKQSTIELKWIHILTQQSIGCSGVKVWKALPKEIKTNKEHLKQKQLHF